MTSSLQVAHAGHETPKRAALVTGASAGIGMAWAEVLASRGFDVVAVARRAERLTELADRLRRDYAATIFPLAADLADPTAPRAIAEELARRGLVIDYLVNNAGSALMGDFTTLDWERQRGFIQLMAIAPIELTRYLAPGMQQRGWGRIVQVSSMAAWHSGSPGMVLYSAAKSMVLKFSEGLAAELRAAGVHCTVSAPGFTATEIFEASGVSGFVTKNKLMVRAMMSPKRVAEEGFAACERADPFIIHGRHHRAWAALAAHTPRRVRYRLTKFGGSIDLD